MNKRQFFIISSIVFSFVLLFNIVSAQEINTTSNVDNSSDIKIQQLDNVKIKEISNIPNDFSILWKDLKNNLFLTFTFDKVKKAEKRLQFAEEKIRVANFITENSNDTKTQEKAKKMIEMADKQITKIEIQKDKLLNNVDEKTIHLLNNLSIHKSNTEKVLDKMEYKTPEAKLEQFQIFRKDLSENGNSFLVEAINNPNIPTSTKQIIINNQQRIEEKQLDKKEEKIDTKNLLQEVKFDDKSIKEANKKETKIIQNIQIDDKSIILYYGETCPHCKVVEQYISDNKINNIIQREVYNNQENAKDLNEKAVKCGMERKNIGVPFLYYNATCLVGDQDIINFLKERQ